MSSYIPNPALRIETAIVSYISTSLSGSGFLSASMHYLTGYGQEDKDGAAIMATCNNYEETYFQTRVYRFNVDVSVKEIAWDTTTSSFRDLGGNVFALFGSNKTASLGISSQTDNLNLYQLQVLGNTSTRAEDAWVSTLNLSIVAALYD